MPSTLLLTVDFNPDLVLYAQKDTLLNSLQYSIFNTPRIPTVPNGRCPITEVGFGNGDYLLDLSSANGRVFKWVAPLNNVDRETIHLSQSLSLQRNNNYLPLVPTTF